MNDDLLLLFFIIIIPAVFFFCCCVHLRVYMQYAVLITSCSLAGWKFSHQFSCVEYVCNLTSRYCFQTDLQKMSFNLICWMFMLGVQVEDQQTQLSDCIYPM